MAEQKMFQWFHVWRTGSYTGRTDRWRTPRQEVKPAKTAEESNKIKGEITVKETWTAHTGKPREHG